MRSFTPAVRAAVLNSARRNGFGEAAGLVLGEALARGHGRMAQFDHPEFGGAGQWMAGGMTMLSGPFDAALKARVERFCGELAELLSAERDPFEPAAGPVVDSPDDADPGWWPADFGRPSASGSQNDVRYAYFAKARRLAVERAGRVTVYDTQGHAIHGVSQQQARSGTLAFTTGDGTVDPAQLPVVSPDGAAGAVPQDALTTIERLAELRERGIITEREFDVKKNELLRRV